MNERIKLLAEQAGLEFDDDLALEPEPIYYTTQTDLAKFAQLIVQECAKVILETPVKYTEIDIMHIIRDNVKEHFGVEL